MFKKCYYIRQKEAIIMKSDWFGVLYEIKNIPIDENLAYELDVFLRILFF